MRASDSQEAGNAGEDPESSTLPPFLSKLYELVESTSAKHIEWGKDGQTFRITNATLFARDLLPLYFKHNSLASFTRQLLTYGFKRCHSPPGSGATLEFGHEHFRQGDRGSLHLIRRRVASKKMRNGVTSAPYDPPYYAAPAAQPGPGPPNPVDNMLVYHVERLRDYVTNVERQMTGALAEIKHQLGEMERYAYTTQQQIPAMPKSAMPVTPGVQIVAAQHSQPPQLSHHATPHPLHPGSGMHPRGHEGDVVYMQPGGPGGRGPQPGTTSAGVPPMAGGMAPPGAQGKCYPPPGYGPALPYASSEQGDAAMRHMGGHGSMMTPYPIAQRAS